MCSWRLIRRCIEFGESYPHTDVEDQRHDIQRYDACQLQQIYAGAVLLAR